MKKFLLVAALMLVAVDIACAGRVNTYANVGISSTTCSNDVLQNITSAEHLFSVSVTSITAGGTISIYDAEKSATNLIAVISLATLNCYPFDIAVSSGITYTTAGNNGCVVITYDRHK